ncbi:phage tail tube protein [Photobacterium atrarenae]|uniref:Phage tail protein n=1 Tax=Photobacterium atrarenae TaxID=865757 RepID=A0ABY5GI97_9GAMM|nr:phage tail tube protein [Photobacterium atrarenae]UTV28999.1 phage tail protein [Photobacterium atrarenae]
MSDPTKPEKGAGTTFCRLNDGVEITSVTDYTDDTPWMKIADIKELQPGEITVEDEADDYLDDPEADWDKTSPGKKSAGETSVTIAWKPGDTAQQQLDKDVADGTVTHYRAKYPNGAVDVWYGYVNSLGKAIPRNEKMTRSFKIKNVGKPKTAEELLAAAPAA